MAGPFRIAKASRAQYREIAALDKVCFPADDPPRLSDAEWWLVRDPSGKPVGYSALRYWRDASAVFLSRAGVLPEARGNGLQKRMIRVRLQWARRRGVEKALSYTVAANVESANSLMAQGFRLFHPCDAWVGRTGILYWMRDVSRPG